MNDADVILIQPRRLGDDRGWFQETWSQRGFEALGLNCDFVQDNHSYSRDAGVVRGLHFQRPPYAQTKLVRCLRGAILDVVVDLRRGAATYGQHFQDKLSARGGEQLLIPGGFAHGFVTLEPDTEVAYKVSAPYAPDHEMGVLWNDPDLLIEWPVSEAQAILSPRDQQWPLFKELVSPFEGQAGSRLRTVDLAAADPWGV